MYGKEKWETKESGGSARREKIRELLELAGVNGMDDIQQLFREKNAEFMETSLNAELDEHLGYDRYDRKEKDTDDSRNGHSSKTLRNSFGYPAIQIPRNRKGWYDPVILRKNQTSINNKSESIADQFQVQI